MTFTDEDVKRLKAWWEKEFGNGWYCQECGINQKFDIPGLLSRLEAAENHRTELLICLRTKCDPWPCKASIIVDEAWRKSCGK